MTATKFRTPEGLFFRRVAYSIYDVPSEIFQTGNNSNTKFNVLPNRIFETNLSSTHLYFRLELLTAITLKNTALSSVRLPTFRGNILPPFSGLKVGPIIRRKR
jgi:hypothetical protein